MLWLRNLLTRFSNYIIKKRLRKNPARKYFDNLNILDKIIHTGFLYLNTSKNSIRTLSVKDNDFDERIVKQNAKVTYDYSDFSITFDTDIVKIYDLEFDNPPSTHIAVNFCFTKLNCYSHKVKLNIVNRKTVDSSGLDISKPRQELLTELLWLFITTLTHRDVAWEQEADEYLNSIKKTLTSNGKL